VSTQLYNIVTFANVAGGATVTLPHLVNEDGRAFVPDLVVGDAAGFMKSDVVVTSTNLTVKNATNDVRSINVWVQRLHTRERFFGPRFVLNLLPLPIIIMPGGDGGGALSDDPPIDVDTAPADPGVSMEGSRADHKHDAVTGVPVAVNGPFNVEGVSLGLARRDHHHRLELDVLDEGALEGQRPAINFVGVGVTAVDNPGSDRVDITIPGTTDGGATVSRSDGSIIPLSTSGVIFIITALSVTVPVAGKYWAIFESEADNQSGSGVLEIGISVNSTVVVVAGSARSSGGSASDMRSVVTTADLGVLAPGDIVRALFRKKAGAGAVDIVNRRLTIFLVQ
jgi:hypothetical protein